MAKREDDIYYVSPKSKWLAAQLAYLNKNKKAMTSEKKQAPPASVSRVGKKNLYTCKNCGGTMVTIDVDEGTTPMIMKCQNKINASKHTCNGPMFSSWYNVPASFQTIEPKYEWYKPDAEQMKKLKGSEKEHVQKGGLLIRPYTKPPESISAFDAMIKTGPENTITPPPPQDYKFDDEHKGRGYTGDKYQTDPHKP